MNEWRDSLVLLGPTSYFSKRMHLSVLVTEKSAAEGAGRRAYPRLFEVKTTFECKCSLRKWEKASVLFRALQSRTGLTLGSLASLSWRSRWYFARSHLTCNSCSALGPGSSRHCARALVLPRLLLFAASQSPFNQPRVGSLSLSLLTTDHSIVLPLCRLLAARSPSQLTAVV